MRASGAARAEDVPVWRHPGTRHIAVRTGQEVIAIGSALGLQNCPSWLNDMRSMSREFEAAMRKVSDAARRAGVYPGSMREARRRHRLDWTGFDR